MLHLLKWTYAWDSYHNQINWAGDILPEEKKKSLLPHGSCCVLEVHSHSRKKKKEYLLIDNSWQLNNKKTFIWSSSEEGHSWMVGHTASIQTATESISDWNDREKHLPKPLESCSQPLLTMPSYMELVIWSQCFSLLTEAWGSQRKWSLWGEQSQVFPKHRSGKLGPGFLLFTLMDRCCFSWLSLVKDFYRLTKPVL